ncbi:MAG: Type 1 glutamine amidotransferase-like domain-containing protein [Thermoanaerobaculia bacterium]
MIPRRLPGAGWLALVGGGEFSFGETIAADRAWMAKVTAAGPIAFLPTASGSTDYGGYFTSYIREGFDRVVDVVPIYRQRDARREKNLQRLAAAAAVYLGGGVTDHLLDALAGEPAATVLAEKLAGGGVVVAIAAAAHALGAAARPLTGRNPIQGLAWLPEGVVETNFDPAHDRRLRQLLGEPEVTWGLGIPAGAAVLLGPEESIEMVGAAFLLDSAEGDLEVLGGP